MAYQEFDGELDAPGYTEFSGTLDAPKDRTWGEALKDTGRGVMSGGAGLVKSAGDLYGLATGNMDNTASELGRNAQDYWQDGESQSLKDKKQARQAAIAAESGIGGKAWQAFKGTVTDPALAVDTVASNLATLLPGAAVGRLAAGAKMASGLNAASRAGPASLAARELAAQAAGSFGTKAAITAGGLQQGADVSGDVYEAALKKTDAQWADNPEFIQRVQNSDGSPQALDAIKRELALKAARVTLPAAAAVSVLANAIPGASLLERSLVGGAARNTLAAGAKLAIPKAMLKGAAGEMAQEGLEEGGGAFAGNVAKGAYVDPAQDWREGVGESAGLGMAGGFLLGGVGGAAQRTAPTPADILKAESVDDAIQSFSGSVSAPAESAMVTAGKQWQALGLDKATGDLAMQRQLAQAEANLAARTQAPAITPQERDGASASRARDQRLNDAGQAWQALGITAPQDELQAQRAQATAQTGLERQNTVDQYELNDLVRDEQLDKNTKVGNLLDDQQEFTQLRDSEARNLQVMRAQSQRDAQKARELDQIPVQAAEQNTTQQAVQRAGNLQTPSAMEQAFTRLYYKTIGPEPDAPAKVEAPTPEPRIVARTENMVPIPKELAELQVEMAGGEVVRIPNQNGKFAYTVIPKAGGLPPTDGQQTKQALATVESAPSATKTIAEPAKNDGLPPTKTSYPYTQNPSGTVLVQGDPVAIRAAFPDTKGVTHFTAGTPSGVLFGVKAAPAVVAQLKATNEAPGTGTEQSPPTPGQARAPVAGNAEATQELPGARSAPVEAAGVEAIGRNNQPLREGGKPFKTKEEASAARKLQPMMRVVKVAKGFALSPKTDKQLAAEAKAAKRLGIARTGQAGVPIAAHEFIAGEGGMDAGTKSEFSFGNNPRVGNRTLFAGARGGMSIETAAEKLTEAGYLPADASHSDVIALINRSFKQPQYTSEGTERMAEAELNQKFDDHLAAQEDAAQNADFDPFDDLVSDGFDPSDIDMTGYDEAQDPIKLEVNALLALAESKGVDVDTIKEDVYEDTKNGSEQDYYEAAKRALTSAIEGGYRDSSQNSGESGNAGEQTGLTAPSRADIEAQQDRADSATKTDTAQRKARDLSDKRERERKDIAARSEAAADSFELGGDAEQNLSGQRGMFDDPATQATTILDAAQITGKERISALKDIKKGDITPEELQAAYPAKVSSAEPENDVKFSIDDSTGDQDGLQPGTQQHQDLADQLAQRINASQPTGSPDRVLYAHSERVDGNERLSRSLAATQAIANRLFGHEVVFVSFAGEPLFNGAMSTKIPGVVFINVNARHPHMAVLGHELLHTLRTTNPEAYAALDKSLTKLLDAEGASKFLAKLESQYKRHGRSIPENWDEELFADVVGDNFMDPQFWQAMAQEQPSAFRRIAQAVMDFLDGVVEKMTGSKPFGTDKMLTDVKAAREAVVQAMREYSGSQVGAISDTAAGERYSISQAQTETAAFKKWFGDSKVVDADGSPLVVYHGTKSDVNEFQSSRGGEYGSGIYLTDDAGAAWMYADRAQGESGQNVLPVYASIKKPYIATDRNRVRAVGVKKLKSMGHDGIIATGSTGEKQYIAFDPEQIKSATGNRGTFDPNNPDIRFSIAGQTNRQHTPEQLRAMKNIGADVETPTLKQRLAALTDNAGKKLAQGLVDQFAPVKDMDGYAYRLLRQSKGASGAFESFLKGGLLKISDGTYDFDEKNKGGVVDKLLMPLQGEHHDFFRWVAANRAERLMGDGKEHLFTKDDINDLKTLADGAASFDYTIQNGARAGTVTRDRTLIYGDALKTFNQFNTNILDMAEQSGLIDPDSRKLWEHEFYVPFYRVADEDTGGIRGMNIKGSVLRQEAFKTLKGGKDKLNADLMDSTFMNWAHLLDAAAKNRAAKATIEAAEALGVAIGGNQSTLAQMGASVHNKNGVVWFMDGGQKRYSLIDKEGDGPFLMTALSALEYAGMRNPVMNAMGTMKHVLTVGVTASPFFKVRNLIRDSLQVVATSNIGANPLANVKQGWKLTNPQSDEYFRLMAGGGTIHFGTMLEGSEAKRIQALVESGVDAATILDSPHKVKAFYRKFIEPSLTAYNELGNRGEAVNRAALYDQLVNQGVSHGEASLQARDMMDFSMQGSFTSIRFLTQVVPFFNARLQGMYKLGRGFKENPARFSAVLGATALFSIALLAAYGDDDDWKKREDWDRNNFWWFKFGGQAFRIPKPFEIGAIATLAERGIEFLFDDEMTGKRLRKQVLTLLSDNLSMNPVPQLVKPLLDVYANKNSFNERPIETMGMEKLKSEYRFNANTSMTARGLSTAANAVTGVVGAETLSPVQIDHMLRGYFGWLGSFVVGAGDILARPATGQTGRASPDLWKMATGGMASDLRDAPSKYVSQMYDQAKELEQVYGTWRSLQKEGKTLEAGEFAKDHLPELRKYRKVENVKRAEAQLNERARIIERSNLSGDEKRSRMRDINAQKDRIARHVSTK